LEKASVTSEGKKREHHHVQNQEARDVHSEAKGDALDLSGREIEHGVHHDKRKGERAVLKTNDCKGKMKGAALFSTFAFNSDG